MGWSFNIGSIAGTAIRLHVTFLLFLVWIFVASYASGGAERGLGILAFMMLLFACVVAHEFGHIFMARAVRGHDADVTLLPIGGVARLERIPEKPREEFLIAIAGPAGERRDRARAGRCCSAPRSTAAISPSDEQGSVPHDRPARDGEPVPGAVQPDPGVSDGRRPRAARAAREPPRLHARDRNRRHRSASLRRSCSASSACSAIRC